MDGVLQTIAFEEGRIIEQGELMFELDRLPFEAALAQARASLMQARAAYVRSRQALSRARPLAQDDAVSQQELEAAIAQEAGDGASVAAAEAAIDQAELNLGYTTIRAPISGLVGTTEVRAGSLVDRRRTIDTREAGLELIKRRHRRGAVSGLDVARAESEVAAALTALPEIERQIIATEHRLRIVLAENPGPVIRTGRHQVEAERARTEQALHQYQQSVQQAFREVSDALNDYSQFNAVHAAQQK